MCHARGTGRIPSETDTANIEELDIEGFCLWPDLWNEEDSSVSSAGSKVDISRCMSEQDNLSYVDVASMGDFNSVVSDDVIGFDSDEGSVSELEWNTWDDACAWEFRNASGNFPIRTMMSLSYDGDGELEWIGHDEDYDCSPAGELGYIPRCLCSPWVMDRMTQYLTEIKEPGSSLMLSKTMYAGGRRRVCTRGTPPVACSAGRFLLALIGHRASVDGSVSHADWSHVIGAVDASPGGVWIDYIRQALGDSQSIVAVPVTGSLVSPALFSCRDAICTARSSLYWTVCGTDWVLPAGYQVLLLEFVECWIMDPDGFSIVDNRAGVTFGVELYVPWDAPEVVVDGDFVGWCSRRDSAFFRGETPVVCEYFFPDCQGLDQNFHDVTVVDMGDLPESHDAQMASGGD